MKFEFSSLAASACCLMLASTSFAFPDPPTGDGNPAQDKPAQKAPEVKPLNVGDKAPAINIEHWVKGEKIEKFEPGKVYVVEFWATWCGPCLQSMPHLSKVADEFKTYGVSVIGISDEPREKIDEFLTKKDKEGKVWNEKITYRLTTDPDRSAHNEYMKAAGETGIPTAFIVGKKSYVEWIGHPMELDAVLTSVVNDSWDREAFKIKRQKQRTLEQDLNKFFTLLARENKPEEAYPIGRKLVKELWNDSGRLNQIAWFILDNPRVQTRDLDLAMEAAQQAYELTNGKAPAIVDTFARAYYEKGDVKNAMRLQRVAVRLAEEGDERMLEDLKQTLKKYEDEFSGKGGG